ncbi:ABC transporter substrate-binding protein [Streptomyces sp. YIM 98790]|uniref:peptide ABC transporter substrate-binding protein n=1 Tax=Streptomyces sp. YIM 98790 TaxID=2689077 RepID=UPI00140BD5EF|nr:ABC transporter substrate-binding protein [Streptomyces sp. YIM 98790]
MRGARSAKWVTGAIVVALAASACGSGDGGSGGSGLGYDATGKVIGESAEPQKGLVPSDTMEAIGHEVIGALWTGLIKTDPTTGEIIYMNAESITTEDSRTWTVTLKDGWTFHDGTPVTAESYVKAWNWAAGIENNQQNSSWFSDIAGYEDVHPAEGEPAADTMSGLKVVDEHTFTIELTEPLAYFNYKLEYNPFFPLPESFYEDPAAAAENPVGNGPYTFVSWEHNKFIDVEKWDDYQGEDAAQNEGVVFLNYADSDAAYQDLLSDNIDYVRQVSPNNLAKFEQDLGDRAINTPYAAIQTVNFAFYTDQWKDIDVKVLQGLSMAIDRETITSTVLQGTRVPANGWVAKGVMGYEEGACGPYCTYDPETAKELIDMGGGVPGNAITIQYNADGGHKEWVEAVCNSIRQAVGVECTGDAKPTFQEDLDARDNKQVGSMYRSGWGMDYPFNGNFLRDLYGTTAGGNKGGFSDEIFDGLVETADAAPTVEESAELYRFAEERLAETFPAIPLWYYEVQSGHSTKVENVAFDLYGHPILTDIEVTGR